MAATITHRPARKWSKVSIIISPEALDAALAFLGEITGAGVEISSDAGAAPPQTETIIGYLEDDAFRQDKMLRLKCFLDDLPRHFPGSRPPALATEIICEEDWGHNWKQYFKTFQASPRLLVKPSWENYSPAAGADLGGQVLIEMDPGLAFGTGHHQSTQLALFHIDSLFSSAGKRPERVLDLGTGSGILAMACALFGAREVLALDNDPDAVAAAMDNVARNGLEKIVTVSGRDLAEINSLFDLITANITHDVLLALLAGLARLLAPGGSLILAGILSGDQEKSLVSAGTELGLALAGLEKKDEWAALRLKREVN